MTQQVELRTHELDDEQRDQLTRALDHFHSAQQVVRLIECGSCVLPTRRSCVDVGRYFGLKGVASPSIAVTGLRLSDNWFSRARSGVGLLTLADWEVAFLGEGAEITATSPDANILASLALVTLEVLSGGIDHDLLHERLAGCLFDLCAHKPDRAIKMRAAFVCAKCRGKLAATGLSSLEVDAIAAVLDRVRQLALGRAPQGRRPKGGNDDEFVERAAKSQGPLPPRLEQACRAGSLTLLVGSGLSLQADVRVNYNPLFGWTSLPAWTDIPLRLSECLKRYRGRDLPPRPTESLEEFLADMDFLRQCLGDSLYYPRAVFDIFTPEIRDAGLANRLALRLPSTAVLTTNYDFLLSCAAPPATPTFTWREARAAREYLAGSASHRPIIKLHGCASRPDTVVLTRLEYENLGQQQEYRSLMRSVFEHHAVLFLGFGMNDPRDLDQILRQATLAGAAGAEKFALIPSSRCTEVQAKFPQVQTIPYQSPGEVPARLAQLCSIATAAH